MQGWIKPDMLACPRCGDTNLREVRDGLLCGNCSEWYEEIQGILDMFPYWEFYGPRRRQWLYWKKTQESAAPVYREDPVHNLAAAGRQDVEDFARFCEKADLPENPLILDVGSGILPDGPSYLPLKNRIGIEPLLPEKSNFPLFRGVAEFLPFRTNLFDACFLGTSVDHFLFPAKAFNEIRRCLKPHGKVLVWAATFAVPISLVSDMPWPAHYTEEKINFPKRIAQSFERLGKKFLFTNRFLKRRFFEGFSYALCGLDRAHINVNVNDPYHLGHYGHQQILSLMEESGFQIARHIDYKYHAASQVAEIFLEYSAGK